MKFFLYYFNYSEFNLENSDILYFGAYTVYTNQMSLQQPIKTVFLPKELDRELSKIYLYKEFGSD